MESRKSTWTNHLGLCFGNRKPVATARPTRQQSTVYRDDELGVSAGSGMSGAIGIGAVSERRPVCSGVRLLCLSIRIRGYDDPDLHLPLAALTLHLYSRDVAMKRFVLPWAVRGMPPKKSLIQSVGVGRGPPNKFKPSGQNAWNSFKTSVCPR